jgi:hypothetical protein
MDVSFDDDVLSSLTSDDLQVANKTTLQTISSSSFNFVSSNTAGLTSAHWTANVLLADGNYEATLAAGSVHDAANQPMNSDYVLPFFVLTGDANRDRNVDLTDFTFLAANFNQSGKTFTDGDFDYSGTVDLTDFTYLASRFNTSLAPPSASINVAAKAVTPLGRGDNVRDLTDLLFSEQPVIA